MTEHEVMARHVAAKQAAAEQRREATEGPRQIEISVNERRFPIPVPADPALDAALMPTIKAAAEGGYATGYATGWADLATKVNKDVVAHNARLRRDWEQHNEAAKRAAAEAATQRRARDEAVARQSPMPYELKVSWSTRRFDAMPTVAQSEWSRPTRSSPAPSRGNQVATTRSEVVRMFGTKTRGRDQLTEGGVERLGEVDGHWFVRYDGAEYRLGNAPMASFEVAEPIRPDEIRIQEPYSRVVDGTRMSGTQTVLGRKVPTGTFGAYRAREEKKREQLRRRQEQRPADLLKGLGRTPAMFVGTPGKSALPSINGTVAYAEGQPPAKGPARRIAHWRRKGLSLELTPGNRLLVRARDGHLLSDYLAAIRIDERLLIGHLAGQPVKCELGHKGATPEATTIVALDIAACAKHAR
jgi:hypothetical protein